MIKAIWNNTVLAQSTKTELVEGNHYFPPEALHREYFEASSTERVRLEGHGQLLQHRCERS